MKRFWLVLICCSAFAQQLPVIDAVAEGHCVGDEDKGVAAVRKVLAAGGNVNERDQAGWTPLVHAALECRAEIVKAFLESGADPNARAVSTGKSFLEGGQTPLLIVRVVLLLDDGRSLRRNGTCPPATRHMK